MLRFLIRYKTVVTAFICLLVSTLMMSSEISGERIYFRTKMFGALFSIEKFVLNSKQSLDNVFTDTQTIDGLEIALDRSESQVKYYRELSQLYNHLKLENNLLRESLAIKSKINHKSYYAQVIFKDPALSSDYLIIDKGYEQGLKVNMPVVCSRELNNRLVLIGKTVEVGDNFSRVRVITAKNFFISVKSLNNEYSGILRGQGAWNQNLAIDYIPVEANPQIGETIFSTGGSDIYPEGLYIGEIRGIGQNVIEEFFQILYLKAGFDYNTISDVFVLDYINEVPLINDTELTNERSQS